MKRAMFLIAAMAVLALPASAQDAVSDHIGMIGFGYFTSDAPVGVRYWTSPSLGFEGGIGFRTENKNLIDEDGDGTYSDTSLMDLAFEAGLLLALNSDSNMILFVRPGVGFVSEQEIYTDPTNGEQSKENATTFTVSAMIGVELFMTEFGFPNLSLGGGHGVALQSISPAAPDADSQTTISSALAEVSLVSSSTLGFHFYF